MNDHPTKKGEKGTMLLGQLTVETLLVAGIGGLTAAVSALFAIFVKGYKRIVKKLDECERDREDLWRAIRRGRA